MEILDAAKYFAYHRGMLQDLPRVDAYRDAIQQTVQPGDVVLDIGTGSGVLAFFACQAGARHVYAIEAGPVVNLARELARANGFADKITFINEMSFRASLPERADVLVTETLWSFGIGEGMIGFLADARNRLLKPDARIVPRSVRLRMALAEMPKLHNILLTMPEDRNGLEFAAMRSYSPNQVLVPFVDPSELLSEPVDLIEIELGPEATPDFGAEVTIPVTREGTVHALAGWFDAELAPGVRLGNPPGKASNWAQTLFPLERGVDVKPGDEITARIETIANGTAWRWTTEIGDQRFDQTSMFGFPHDTTAHRRRAAQARPARAPAGEAMLFVLERLDGATAVDDIAAEAGERFAALFGQPGAAAQFVRDVAERYGTV